MKGPSAKTRIALGQVGLVLSLLLTAAVLGVIPDRDSAVREGRATLAEALAVNSSVFLTGADLRRLEADLRLIVDRNADILSAAVRRASGNVVISLGNHEEHWEKIEEDQSTDSQLQVPLWDGEGKWGQLELRFRSLAPSGLLGFVDSPLVRLLAFIAVSSFIVFFFYLGKMLKQLDPSQAIPARVRSALDTMAEGLLVLDLKGRVVLANQAFADIVDKPPDDLLGFRAADFPWVPDDGSPSADADYPWLKALNDGVPQKNQMVRLQSSAETQQTFMTNCSPVLGAGGKPGGVLVSFDDVTELEEKEAELRKSKNEAEAANQAKSDFLANMSHEIRTPMNAILGFTEVLKRGYGKRGQDSKKYLNTIHASGKHLLELINDILDLSKVESGRLELETRRFAPHLTIHEVIQILGVRAREKGITLEFVPQGPIPETIDSDPGRLRQIITNLVGNAIKFTEEGGVRVLARLERSSGEPRLVIEVTDTGIGMAAEQLDAIFDPFVQADTSITRRFGGTGLGLAISRRFAQALGGDITVRSEAGKGSTFTVTLETGPLDAVTLLEPREALAADSEIKVVKSERWEFPAAHILVVDDGDENRELLRLVLEEAGLRVDGAENGQVGVDKALAQPFDAILMDIQMPVMDGLTATRMLREQGIQTPIVALTANAMKGFEQELRAGGFTDYMTKPIDLDALMEKLAELLGGEAREQLGVDQELHWASSEESAPSNTSLGSAPIVSRLAAANPRLWAIVARFVDRLDEQLGAMESAWKAKDFNELAELAHWLKGAGGTVGYDVFTDPALRLEEQAKGRSSEGIDQIIWELRELADRLVIPDAENAAHSDVSGVLDAPAQAREPSSTDQPARTSGEALRLVSRLAKIPKMQAIIVKFAARLDEQLRAMENAWRSEDFDELAELAHWLKGAGGTVGFDEFTDPACNLEGLAKTRSTAGIEDAIAELRCLANAIVLEEINEERAPISAAVN
jgi:signal transduction histidine kinase/CheY-like chemotaxis protein/HPt (histidine-containing phosphotransfer) domain-containing protein